MKRYSGRWVVASLAVGLLACCASPLFVVYDFSGERVLFETSIDSYSIRLERHPRDDLFERRSLMCQITRKGQTVSGPRWMGSLIREDVEFAEYRYPEDGVVLVYDREMPDYILAGIDTKNNLIWPHSGLESDQRYAAGRKLVAGVNQRYGTNFEIADFHIVKRW